MRRDLINRIALGTAQFGLDYGINNLRGKIPAREVFLILETARNSGIDTLDTAYSYGMSEEVIGKFIERSRADLKIISKCPSGKPEEIKDFLNISLKRLKVSGLYGYLIHSFESFLNDQSVFFVFQQLKQERLVGKIGFSLYYPRELEYLLVNNIEFDLLQIPFSIFDRRFSRFFPELKKKGVEIHARSVFLQGLLFKSPKNLPEFFKKVKKILKDLHIYATNNQVSVSSLAANFVLANNFIDKAVVGIDSQKHLQEIISSLKDFSRVNGLIEYLDKFEVFDENVLVPTRWPQKK